MSPGSLADANRVSVVASQSLTRVRARGHVEATVEALSFQAGARYDWSRYVPRETTVINVGGAQVPVRERSFGVLSGSIGILYAVTASSRGGVPASATHSHAGLQRTDSDGPHLAANSYDAGNPELTSETGTGFDMFARHTGEHIRGEVAVFRVGMRYESPRYFVAVTVQ